MGNKRHHTTKILILPCGLSLASCVREDIRIGFLGGLTGPQSQLGVSGRNGALLRVEQANDSGGVAGRRVRLEERDDGNDPAMLQASLWWFEEEGVQAVVGPFTSAMAALVAGRKEGPLFVSPTATAKSLAGLDDYLVRVLSINTKESIKIAEAAARRWPGGSVSVAIDTDNAAYGEPFYEEFAARAEALGVKAGDVVRYSSKSSPIPYASIADRLARLKPSSVLLITSGTDAAMLLRALKRDGIKGPYLVAGWAVTSDLIGQGGAAAEGVLFAQQYDPLSDSPAFLDFKKAYTERYGEEPGFSALHAWEAVNLILGAIERGGDATATELKRRILEASMIHGLEGSYPMDRFGDPEKEFKLYEIRSGAFCYAE